MGLLRGCDSHNSRVFARFCQSMSFINCRLDFKRFPANIIQDASKMSHQFAICALSDNDIVIKLQ